MQKKGRGGDLIYFILYRRYANLRNFLFTSWISVNTKLKKIGNHLCFRAKIVKKSKIDQP